MQFVSGRSLQSVVDEEGPLSVRAIVRIAIQIADGLAAAHEQGLIHRDVKPANVLTERDVTRVMITDFGLARAVDDVGMTQTGWLTGTPHYMSPEQAKGDDVDPRSDLFSLGSLMYFLATGRVPFRASRSFGVIQKIINEQPAHANSINPDVPIELASIISKLHAKNPRERFQSASETADILRDYLAHLQQPNAPMPPIKLVAPVKTEPVHSPNDNVQNLVIVVGIVSMLVVVGVFSIFLGITWLNQTKSEPGDTAYVDSPRTEIKEADVADAFKPRLLDQATEPSITTSQQDTLFGDLQKFEQDLDDLEQTFGIVEEPSPLPNIRSSNPMDNWKPTSESGSNQEP